MGYWDEKRKYEREKNKINIKNSISSGNWKTRVMDEESKTCSNCKKKNVKIVSLCNGFHFNTGFLAGYRLCKDCAKKCKKCGKSFCPKHIKKHKCK